MNEWEEHEDEESGRKYYYNPNSEQSVWDAPPENATIIKKGHTENVQVSKKKDVPDMPLVPSSSKPMRINHLVEQSHLRSRSASVSPKMGMMRKTLDDWDEAKGARKAAVKEAENIYDQTLPPGWTEYTDEDSHEKYYVNVYTNESTWDRPTEPAEKASSTSGLQNDEEHDDGYESGEDSPVMNGIYSASLPALSSSMSTAGPRKSGRNSVLLYLNENGKDDQCVSLSFDKSKTFEAYAKVHFQKHKKGLFRTIGPEKLIQFQKSKISSPLHKLMKPNLVEDSLRSFDIILEFMNGKKAGDLQLAKELLNISWKNVPVRDEICAQICKQCNKNISVDSTIRGLQLFSLVVTSFPPASKFLQQSLQLFLQEMFDQSSGEVKEYVKGCAERLQRAIVTGPLKTLPSSSAIDRAMKPHPPKPVFGVTLKDYMTFQCQIMPQEKRPYVLVTLSEAIQRLNGFQAEGLFRLPGDTHQVEYLREQFAEGNFEITTQDPHVCGSLFKLWLRELAEPIIPNKLYDKCLDASLDHAKSFEVLEEVPYLNRVVLTFLIEFLNKMTDPEIQKSTKMSIENLAVVFTPNILRSQSEEPRVIMMNAPREQSFVANLIQHFPTMTTNKN